MINRVIVNDTEYSRSQLPDEERRRAEFAENMLESMGDDILRKINQHNGALMVSTEGNKWDVIDIPLQLRDEIFSQSR